MRFIGSKALLISEIEKILKENAFGNENTFLDLFAGTNVVGNFFKEKYTVYSNDFLYFSYINAKAIIENNGNLQFKKLKETGITSPLDYLQENADLHTRSNSIGYYENNYTPTGEAMYFTVENGKRIDFIRDKIDEWKNGKLLTEIEYYYLINILIEAIPYVSNITGTYGAFLKHWDKRALNPLELVPIEVKNNGKKNKAFNEDSNILAKKVSADIVYIDPPYNSRQYASNYHLLENIAKNNKPILSGKTKIFDWSELRSNYSMKKKALEAMTDLINNINATHVVVSYNNEGIISETELINVMKSQAVHGEVKVKKIPYKKYKSKRPSNSYYLYEMLLYIQKKENTLPSFQVTKPKFDTIERWTEKKQQYIKSPLNYIGGKYRLLKQIIPLLPKDINTFIDLFSGGANVGINVEANHYIFNDMNSKINEMFRFFSTHDEEDLILKIKRRIKEFELSKTNEAGYLKFRTQYNKKPNPLDLYILVSYSYNYQFRFNNSMEFNNPFGRNRSCFSENMEKNLRKFLKKLINIDAIFTDQLFNELDLSNLEENDFVYLDPPYLITTGNYNDGNRGFLNWGEEQEKEMYQLLRELTNQKIRWALSNVTVHKGRTNKFLLSFIKNEKCNVNYLDFSYNNSSHNTKRKESSEVLVTNYDQTSFKILNS
ncbi:Dam family site-specific DNA-(adenine-N6)-methyltransferase [Tetragenococcus halophilus]|uniref:Dam family site-specific DNA-(adenine-N6)-methyltransferase n=1 Tax=Tetragenococcus halophilus TaxID=51669 RepID=UPI0025B27F23|nr:Dam family site-specific DNA-(adenine-N6)-methyltransferase [Tetragenococcus halophilus]WJS82361.1 Dam family site-specific DNA-(adenine-N6)-methyltransferase [Tetragenococcus halophilus]